jgi:hypothetical protein
MEAGNYKLLTLGSIVALDMMIRISKIKGKSMKKWSFHQVIKGNKES